MNPKHTLEINIMVGILSGGIVSLLSGAVTANPLSGFGGFAAIIFALIYAVLIRKNYGKLSNEEQKIMIYSKIENLQNQLFYLKLNLISNNKNIDKDVSLKNKYDSIIFDLESKIRDIDDSLK